MTLNETILQTVKEIANEIKAIFHLIMEGQDGVNDKVHKNTLVDSDIYNELEVTPEDVSIINIFINDYIDYIEYGRSPCKWPPPEVIAEWAGKKGLPTDNKTIYAFCYSIYKYGISPRPVLSKSLDEIDEFWDEWSNRIFKNITDYIENKI